MNKNIALMFVLSAIILVLLGIFCFKQRSVNMIYKVSNQEELLQLFPKSPEEIQNRTDKTIQEVDKIVKEIISIPQKDRTFANTMKAIDSISYYYSPFYSTVYSLEVLSPDKNVRDAAHDAVLKLSNFLIDKVSLNLELYNAVKSYVDGNAQKESLGTVQKYFVKEIMDDYRRSGLHLPEKELEKVRKTTKDLAELTLNFDSNIAQYKCSVRVELKDLSGLKEDFINSLQKNDKGEYLLGCDYPTYFNIMDNCTIEATRQKLYNAFSNRAYPQNIEVLEKIIAKRDELAKLTGYESYAHLSLENQMAGSPEKVEKFLNDLVIKAGAKAKKEIKMFLADLPESVTLNKEGQLKPWDSRFIKNIYKQKFLNLDEQKVSEYFPMDHTIKQLLGIYEKFLQLKFKEVSIDKLNGKFWHEDVKLIEAYDAKTDKLLGYLLLDLYPRENKFSHAAHITIIPAIQDQANNPSVAIVMANFPKPTKDRPSLLKFKDVVTFFHEFGHAMHSLLGRTELHAFAGTNVKKDFVELPSQMLEGWLKDKDIIKMVSKHYKTGQPLPDDMIATIINLEKFDSGDNTLKQLYFAFLSLNYFKSGASKNTHKIAEELYKKILNHIAWQIEDNTEASFGHLTDYGASYYGYLWSNVFAKDLFNEIKKHGLLDPEIGARYIREVIGKGGSQDPNELLRAFLGREPNQEAFLRDLGFDS